MSTKSILRKAIILLALVASLGLNPIDTRAQEERKSSYFCACDQRKCDCRFHAQKPGKCVCGKPLKARTAKYACDCGRECDCGSISMKPGNCVCGTPMKEVK
ncbi:MAG: hypothetical protein ACE5KK_03620 [Candidatus Brocadiales bacterium]